ncbi:MAG: DUF5011 domain-containing protein [Bacteroidetes bacterium]|nr:DUF5011 domain-containing protein [Bacteroidota bacterium]
MIGDDKVCKSNYIEVVPSENMCTNSLVTSASGRFYDDGGKLNNYASSNNCTMLIDPCASTVTMVFNKFNVYNGYGYLKVWDGKDATTGKPLHTGQGWTGTSSPGTLVAKSGKMYIEWKSTYNYQTPGWEAEWTSTPGNFTPPSSGFSAPNSIYAGGIANLTATSYDPNANYEWFVGGTSSGTGNVLSYLFASSGQYDVCLIATNCGGSDTTCKSINVLNPTAAPTVDFKIDYQSNTNACYTAASSSVRINVGDTVTLMDMSDQGPYQWNWSASSANVVFIGNTTDQNTQITVTTSGTYDISLDATNGIGTGSLTKSGYLEVGNGYCIPSVSTLISDVGINSVVLGSINNQSTSGVKSYSDYSALYSTCLSRGGKYGFTIGRNTSLNPINRKIWIDYNQDGTFSASELVASQTKTTSKDWSDSILIPTTAKLGKTAVRIAASFSNQSNSACGTNQFGEFEDYTLYIIPDVEAPIISLLGTTPSYVQRGLTYADAGATAWDAVDGNLTSSIVVTGIPASTLNVDSFYVSYNVSDLSGNAAATVKRKVIVSADATGPVVTLNGNTSYYVEVNNAFNDPGATAYDSVSGVINTINITGSVNTSVLGVYTKSYEACDPNGNCTIIKRTITVGDTTRPVVTIAGNNPMTMTVGTSFTDPGVSGITDNYWNNLTSTTTSNLNTNVIGTYQVTYSSKDGSNNIGSTIRTVNVVDDVAPGITLIGGDTIYVEAMKNVNFVDPGYYATDNYYPSVSVSPSGSIVISKSTIGTTQTITYSATDGSGNTTTKTRYVIVRKTTLPWVTLIGNSFDVVSWGPAGSVYTDPGINKNDYFYDAADLTLTPSGTVDMTTPGAYELKYTIKDPLNNTSLTVTRVVNVVVRAGVSTSASTDNNISVYPNPSTGVFNIELSGDVKYNSIVITNALGQQVYTTTSNIVGGVYTVDLSGKASGVYFITLRNNENIVVKKVKMIN